MNRVTFIRFFGAATILFIAIATGQDATNKKPKLYTTTDKAYELNLLPYPKTGPMKIRIEAKIAGEWRNWLELDRHNEQDSVEGWHPCYTNIVSDYKPIVTKHGDRWEITFTSEIAEDLP